MLVSAGGPMTDRDDRSTWVLAWLELAAIRPALVTVQC